MNLEINAKELPRYCPLHKKEIECVTCFETGMVAEGILPEKFWPSGVNYTEETSKECLACQYHIH